MPGASLTQRGFGHGVVEVISDWRDARSSEDGKKLAAT